MKSNLKSKALAFAGVLALSGAGTVFAGPDDYKTGGEISFSAVTSESMESIYSAGVFGSDVDDFIDVTDWRNLELSNYFIFLGGTNKSNSYPLTGGFAKMIGNKYFALFYSGNLWGSTGTTTNSGADKEKNTTSSSGDASNNFALLFGSGNLGLRLDLSGNDNSKGNTYGGKPAGTQTYSGDTPFTMALSAGYKMEKLAPVASLAFQFPSYTKTYQEGDDAGKLIKQTYKDAKIGLKLETGDIGTTGLSAWLSTTGGLGTTEKTKDPDTKVKSGTFWYNKIHGQYKKELPLGSKAAFAVKPQLDLVYATANNKTTGDIESDPGAYNYFSVNPYIDAGFKYAPVSKLAFYTGIRLDLLNFAAGGKSKGDDKSFRSEWELQHFKLAQYGWNDTDFSGNLLKIGAVFTPTPALSIGMGLDGLIDNFIKIDAQSYEVTFFDGWKSDGFGFDNIIPGSVFSNMKFYLTVSYKPGAGAATESSAE